MTLACAKIGDLVLYVDECLGETGFILELFLSLKARAQISNQVYRNALGDELLLEEKQNLAVQGLG